MATIFDLKEPNGQGMFSQAGRVTIAKYAIFKKHDELFNNQKRVIKVTALPALAIDISKKENQPKRKKDIKEEAEETSTISPAMPKKPVIPPFARQLSRQEVNKVKEVKTTTPTHGLYTPKFESIHRSTSVMVNYDKEKCRPATSGPIKPIALTEEDFKPIPDKPKKKVLGSVFFKHQTARQFFKRTDTQPEQRLSEPQFVTPPPTKLRHVASCQTLVNRPSRGSNSSRRSVASFSITTFGSPKGQAGPNGPNFKQMFGKRLTRNSSDIPLNLDNCSPKNDNKPVEGEETTKTTQGDGDFVDVLFFTQKRVSSRLSMRRHSRRISEIKKSSEGVISEVGF